MSDSMQVAAPTISFETALLSASAATMMPAATKASKSAYSTDEMHFRPSIVRLEISVSFAWPSPFTLSYLLNLLGNSGVWRGLIHSRNPILKDRPGEKKNYAPAQ